MNTTMEMTAAAAAHEGLAERAGRLAAEFAARAEAHDRDGSFVAENYARLKEEGLTAAAVPAELGGEGADVGEMADAIRRLAHGCGSTALAFAMHTHQVVIPAWRWRNQPAAAAKVEPVLRLVAGKGAILLSSGGGDWVGGSGRAEKAEGGWHIHAVKPFVSGGPAGTLLMTTAIADDGILHFAVPMTAPEVRRRDNWNTLGMRGTGSDDVAIDGFFLAEDKAALKRPKGEWHPLFQIIATLAFPLIYAAYVGIAESARDIALGMARKRAGEARQPRLVGEMETALRAAQIAHRRMVEVARDMAPSAESVSEVMIGRQLVEQGAIRAVELAMELAAGQGFYRAAGLERRFRDVQGARYHPMRREVQRLYTGSLVLGDPVANIY
ncbi:MAG: acyl-CoA/acyl-ACP dehydrogenase [Proteobacteria bacterium]|nr:acyl-CoA/acyl-ACP dehydrogenase [Pseudomonadota bacterium]